MRWIVLICLFLGIMGCGDEGPSKPANDSNEPVTSLSSSEASKIQSSSVAASSAVIEASSSAAEPRSSATTPRSSAEILDKLSSSENFSPSESDLWYFDDTDGDCEMCNNFTAKDPVLTDRGGEGSITTYGDVTTKEFSNGGACNYGSTKIQYYAAIHVNVSSGDDKGPWNNGLACGGCVRVKAKTPEGWKRVTVRIMDRCPDANCGVDLGGAPASDIMGMDVGRYYGEWEFVSCEGVENVWDDSTSIWVKEGASAYWSIIQIRNPKDAVKEISISATNESADQSATAPKNQVLKSAIEAENFWTMPQDILQSDEEIELTVTYRSGTPDTWKIKGSSFTKEETTYYLYDYRK